MKLATRLVLAFNLLLILVGCSLTMTNNTVRVFSFDTHIKVDSDIEAENKGSK